MVQIGFRGVGIAVPQHPGHLPIGAAKGAQANGARVAERVEMLSFNPVGLKQSLEFHRKPRTLGGVGHPLTLGGEAVSGPVIGELGDRVSQVL
jgi:hypothetical protein